VRARLVAHPGAWRWSSYPGCVQPSQRRAWVAYDALLRAWRGEYGGKDPAAAYRRFVEAGLAQPPSSPFREAFGGWVLGSARFVERVRALAGPVGKDPLAPEARALAGLSVNAILAAVARYYGVAESELSRRHGSMEARAAAAWLCRRYAEAPQRELAPLLGLSGAGSVPNLTRWLDARLVERPELSEELSSITRLIGSGAESAGGQADRAKGRV